MGVGSTCPIRVGMADVVAGMAFTNQHTFVFYAATLVPCADPIAVPFDTRRVPQGTDQPSTLRRGLSIGLFRTTLPHPMGL